MAQAGKTFRVFVSSTFSDLKAERNALQEKVFPKLRALCMQRGCRFQAIDLRWGVSEEASVDQQTMPICMEELRRCQKITPRPNFIVLLGQRYGWLPIPPYIRANEFENLVTQITDADKKELLKQWYRRDDNAVPAEYVLQPRRRGEYVDGNICILRLENLPIGPPIITPWHSPQDDTHAFGCVFCRKWSVIPESALGKEIDCLKCGKRVKLNPFTINADWRPIAKGWGDDSHTVSGQG